MKRIQASRVIRSSVDTRMTTEECVRAMFAPDGRRANPLLSDPNIGLNTEEYVRALFDASYVPDRYAVPAGGGRQRRGGEISAVAPVAPSSSSFSSASAAGQARAKSPCLRKNACVRCSLPMGAVKILC